MAPEKLAALAAIDLERMPLVTEGTRLGMPLTGMDQFIGIGLNYCCDVRFGSEIVRLEIDAMDHFWPMAGTHFEDVHITLLSAVAWVRTAASEKADCESLRRLPLPCRLTSRSIPDLLFDWP